LDEQTFESHILFNGTLPVKNVFICTHIHDAHAILVQTVLEAAGHRVVRWIGADCPTRQTQSLKISPSPQLVMKGEDASFLTADFDVVWWRRLTPAFLPRNIHPGDMEIAEREWNVMYDSLANVFKPDALWINSFEGQRLANDKIRQLICAKEIGLRVPNTLVSNDIDDIRSFMSEQSTDVVHKMFTPTSWTNSERIARARTTIVTTKHLEHESSLRLCPGIFQERIPKQKEIRATFMGDTCIAVEIDPKDDENGVCDWRSIPQEHWRLRPFDLPESIHKQCLEVMKRLKIVFGCFDLILSESGEYVFLEVNQMGQFLWIEDDLPNMHLLSAFCNFIVSGGTRTSGDFSIPMMEVSASASYNALMDSELNRHVNIKPYLLNNAY
jgi:glutathione synthase/RimK-type ligase-like ATP-grasp enzyme